MEETITHPQLIEAYQRVRATKDEAFIKVYSHDDEHFKEVVDAFDLTLT